MVYITTVCFRSRDSNIFRVVVNVAARSKIDFNLTYQELLQRKLGIYEHVINIDPGQVVRDLQVDVYIRESREITLLRVPPIRSLTDISQVTDPNAGVYTNVLIPRSSITNFGHSK